MHVGEREDILRYGGLVGLLDTREGEGARDEKAGRRIPFWRRSVGVEGTTVIFGGTILISEFRCQLIIFATAWNWSPA